MDLNLKNKKVLVWGASQGIGLAVAKSFKAEGATVTVVSRSEEKLKKVCKENNLDHYIAADLSEVDRGVLSVDQAIKLMGCIDIFVINTGGTRKTHLRMWNNHNGKLTLNHCG